MKKIELKELVGGALQEQFGKSFEKVIENLQNPNTPFKNSLEIFNGRNVSFKRARSQR